MKEKKNVVLADCEADIVLPLAEQLTFHSNTFEVKESIANWKRTGKISEFKRYAKYFAVAFLHFLKRKEYDAVVGWQQFYALIFAFYCSVFSVKKENIVVALNFTYKEKHGKVQKLYHWFMSKCLSEKYMDYIHVLSNQYADQIHKEFGFSRDRIIVTGFGVMDQSEALGRLDSPAGYKKDSYALAIGRSNRDYDFLIRAWEGISYPLVIISDTYAGKTDHKHISILTDVAGEESYPWIANCGLMIIPIEDGSICSGDTVLLTAMSMSKKIIVTTPSTLAEMYIKDGENAVLTKKNIGEFQTKINAILYSDLYKSLGSGARESFLNSYTIQSMGKEVSRILNAK